MVSLRPLLRSVRNGGRRAGAAAFERLVRVAAATAAPRSGAGVAADPASIFVLRNNDIGDLLIVTPLFEALRRRFPAAHLAAGVGSWNLDVLAGNPHLSEVLPVNAHWFNKYQARTGPWGRWRYLLRSPEVRTLAARRFELGIDVLGSAWGALLLLRAGVPCRLGIRGYAGGESGFSQSLEFDPNLQVGRSALRFAELLGARELPPCRPQLFLDPEEKEAGERAWAEREPDGRRQTRILIGPGGGLEAKRWPAERFEELVRRLPETVSSSLTSLLVLGGPGEEELVARVAAAHPRAWKPPSPPGLRAVFGLVQACDVAVCNSSMLLHAAAAFARPSVVLLGPSFPSARRHQAQWGYPDLSRSLGREAESGDRLTPVEEALAAVRTELARLG